MIAAPLPPNEQERLIALRAQRILDTPAEAEFDELVQLASQICEAEISLISLIDESRQWFKAKVGLEASETPREMAFCAHAILEPEIFEINDTHQDERFVDNPLVLDDPRIRFYAGMPLETSDGFRLGTLCVIDRKPRSLNNQQRYALKVLAHQAIKLMELRIRNMDLERNVEVRNRLLSVIAHDVRGSLNSIKILSEFLADGLAEPDEIPDLLKEMHKVSNRTAELVENILNWSRNIENYQMIKPGQVSLELICNEIKELYTSQCSEKQLSLVTDLGINWIEADLEMMRFMIRNLVANAIKFSSHGTITIKAHLNNQVLELSVQDQGIGMTPEVMQKLFNWDKRYTELGTANEKGTGIGLLLVREFVHRHEGELKISSSPGQGTTMTLRIPQP